MVFGWGILNLCIFAPFTFMILSAAVCEGKIACTGQRPHFVATWLILTQLWSFATAVLIHKITEKRGGAERVLPRTAAATVDWSDAAALDAAFANCRGRRHGPDAGARAGLDAAAPRGAGRGPRGLVRRRHGPGGAPTKAPARGVGGRALPRGRRRLSARLRETRGAQGRRRARRRRQGRAARVPEGLALLRGRPPQVVRRRASEPRLRRRRRDHGSAEARRRRPGPRPRPPGPGQEPLRGSGGRLRVPRPAARRRAAHGRGEEAEARWARL